MMAHKNNTEKITFILRLIILYVTVMIGSAVASFIVPNTPTTAAWHIVIVALLSLLTLRFAMIYKKSNGAKSGLLRIFSIILIVALIVTTFILGLPLWMQIEHIVCVFILLPVAILSSKDSGKKNPDA